MKKINILSILAVMLIIFACNSKKDSNSRFPIEIVNSESFIKVDSLPVIINNHESQVIPYSEISKMIKDVKYIPLKSKEPIGIIDQIAIYDDKIFILDAFKNEMVFIFNLSGDLIKIIHDKGAGPQEYLGLSDMSISKRDSLLVINDRLSLHTLFYSLDGNFISKERSIPNFYFEMFGKTCFNQLTYGQSFSYDVNYQLVVSLGDSIIRKGFQSKPIQLDAVNSKSLKYNYKDELLFSPVLSDTIYHIINDYSYCIKYIINQKKSIWKKSDENLNHEEYRDLVKHSNYTYLGKPIIENKNYLFYSICFGNNGFIQEQAYWYDKNKNISFTVANRESETAPISAYLPKPQGIFKNYFIGVIEADEISVLKEYIKQGDNANLFYDKRLKSILLDQAQDLECIIVLYDFL